MKNKLKRRIKKGVKVITLAGLVSISSGLSGPYYGDRVANFFVHHWDKIVKGLKCEIYEGNKHIHGDELFIEEIKYDINNIGDNGFRQTAMSFNTLSQSDEYKCYASLGISYINASDMRQKVAIHAIPYIRDKIGDKTEDKKFINSVLNSVKQKGLQSLLVHLGSFRKTYKEKLSKQHSVKDKFLHFYGFENEEENGFAAQKKFLDNKEIKLIPCSSQKCWINKLYQD